MSRVGWGRLTSDWTGSDQIGSDRIRADRIGSERSGCEGMGWDEIDLSPSQATSGCVDERPVQAWLTMLEKHGEKGWVPIWNKAGRDGDTLHRVALGDMPRAERKQSEHDQARFGSCAGSCDGLVLGPRVFSWPGAGQSSRAGAQQ